MKSKLFLLLVLIIGFVIFLATKFFWLDNTNAVGRLKIDSNLAASVFVNNVAIGRTPYEDKYKVGEYVLKLIPEEVATSTASWQRKININKNALTYINADLGTSDLTTSAEVFSVSKAEKKISKANMGDMYVETEPSGTIIYLDNDEKGVSPLYMSDITPGDHELSVFMPGFFRRTEKVNIIVDYKINAYMKLAIDEGQQKTVKNENKPVASDEAKFTQKTMILIKDTPTGWLRVRSEPNLDASEEAKIKPGETYEFVEEQEGWLKIKLDMTKEGWISAIYGQKKTQ